MWVKICANTNLEDTQLGVDLGADAVGFVFAPSARRVTPEQAGSITSALRTGTRPVERIGVFQTTDFEEIRRAVARAGLTGVQLHHEPEPALIGALRAEFGDALTLAQTLHWATEGPSEAIAATLASAVQEMGRASGFYRVDRVLVDSKVGSALGGTGRTFDWDRAGAVFRSESGMRMIVAGGLSPENVGEAVERLNPWGVDVASGVERSAGRKDPERLRLFIERARAAGETAAG